MSQKPERTIRDARRAAEVMRELGIDKRHIEAVEGLCRSNASLQLTCSRLWHDNQELRAKLRGLGAEKIGDPDD